MHPWFLVGGPWGGGGGGLLRPGSWLGGAGGFVPVPVTFVRACSHVVLSARARLLVSALRFSYSHARHACIFGPGPKPV